MNESAEGDTLQPRDPNSGEDHQSPDIIDRLCTSVDVALDELRRAKPFAKSRPQTDLFQAAEILVRSTAGMRALLERADQFDPAGVFHGGPWVDPRRLQPHLVAGSLEASGVYSIVETLSELRMLAIAEGRRGDDSDQAHAKDFLEQVLALNLDLLFPDDSESDRRWTGHHRENACRLFKLLAENLDLSNVLSTVVTEIELISAQRPINSQRLRSMIETATRVPENSTSADLRERLGAYATALSGASELSRAHPSFADYRRALETADEVTIAREAEAFAHAMNTTGLTCGHHAVLLRRLRRSEPTQIPQALGLNELGTAEFSQNLDLALKFLRVGILPGTAASIYGFARMLELGLLSRQEVSVGLTRIIDLDLASGVRKQLLSRRRARDGATANSLLLAGAFAVLGHPLGVGQGRNPTCQAARGISLWAQHAPGYLLELVVSAARDDMVEFQFEGQIIRSSELLGGLASGGLHAELDPVSLILVPHLDRVYEEMMRRVLIRPEDGHKWANPALYGRWVPSGFASCFSRGAAPTVTDYDDFVRRFFATHHPAYNDGHALMYPNPVGILVTDSRGEHLGPHAVSIQRVEPDSHGNLRVFFYNPNNEGRQNWGGDVEPSVTGHGEREGESSLPFHQFASRLYAFHFNPYEEGDAYAVPESIVREIERASKDSWGRAFTWESL